MLQLIASDKIYPLVEAGKQLRVAARLVSMKCKRTWKEKMEENTDGSSVIFGSSSTSSIKDFWIPLNTAQ